MSHTIPNCSDYGRTNPLRRDMLKMGSIGALCWGLSSFLEAEAKSANPTTLKQAKNVILLFQFGGPSHLDTFDPKPNAPKEIRGEFGTIPTKLPGIRFTEHLPRLARMADKFALVRSVNHNRSSHNPGAYYSLTGREPLIDLVTLNASAIDFPHPGSIVSYLLPATPKVPAFVSLPTMIADGPFRTPGEFGGFLGKAYDPLWVLRDPNSASFNADEFSLPKGIDFDRANYRQSVLRDLDKTSRLTDRYALVKGMNEYQSKAMDMLLSPATKKAFDIQAEPARVRDRYGRTTYGQSTLLARRLVEAGVRFVTVYYSPNIGGWDTHKDNFETLRKSRLPQTDQTVSALLEDLQARGLLEDTLVYWTGDFGRTPKINKDAGRDHWPPCQTILMAGGGIQGGRIYGASDATGAFPHDSPVKPDDVIATVFHSLGLDPKTEIRDQLSRPMPIAAGQPIRALFA